MHNNNNFSRLHVEPRRQPPVPMRQVYPNMTTSQAQVGWEDSGEKFGANPPALLPKEERPPENTPSRCLRG
eukprot:scaffold1171_cov177-Amphora_coffeaeformis.AAC.24